jgi:hypothetical protein
MAPGTIIDVHDQKTGKLIGKLLGSEDGPEFLALAFEDGRLVEKAYLANTVRPRWLQFLLDHLPF